MPTCLRMMSSVRKTTSLDFPLHNWWASPTFASDILTTVESWTEQLAEVVVGKWLVTVRFIWRVGTFWLALFVLFLGYQAVGSKDFEFPATDLSNLQVQRFLEVNELLELDVGNALALPIFCSGDLNSVDAFDLMEVEEILDVFDGCLIAQPIKEDYLIVFLGSLPRTVTELLDSYHSSRRILFPSMTSLICRSLVKAFFLSYSVRNWT